MTNPTAHSLNRVYITSVDTILLIQIHSIPTQCLLTSDQMIKLTEDTHVWSSFDTVLQNPNVDLFQLDLNLVNVVMTSRVTQ